MIWSPDFTLTSCRHARTCAPEHFLCFWMKLQSDHTCSISGYWISIYSNQFTNKYKVRVNKSSFPFLSHYSWAVGEHLLIHITGFLQSNSRTTILIFKDWFLCFDLQFHHHECLLDKMLISEHNFKLFKRYTCFDVGP